MTYFQKARMVLEEAASGFLFNDRFRYLVCKWRWRWLRSNLRIIEDMNNAVGKKTIAHNLSAFNDRAVFGMARRMSLLLFPTAALLKDNLKSSTILIVGPRTEDDIFWAKSLGLKNTAGIDLFSYSKYIQVGDIHRSGLASHAYDAVLLAWMLSYTHDPVAVIAECKRLLKPGGYLGIGIEVNPASTGPGDNTPRVNMLNSAHDLIEMVRCPVVFNNDPLEPVRYDCGVIFKIP